MAAMESPLMRENARLISLGRDGLSLGVPEQDWRGQYLMKKLEFGMNRSRVTQLTVFMSLQFPSRLDVISTLGVMKITLWLRGKAYFFWEKLKMGECSLGRGVVCRYERETVL